MSGANLTAQITLTGKDDGASAAVNAVKQRTDALSASMADFTAKASAADAINAKSIKTLGGLRDAQKTVADAIASGAGDTDKLAKTSSALADAYSKVEAGLSKTVSGFKTISVETAAASEATHTFSLATAGAQRELAVMGGELLKGNYGQFEKSLTTLARQTGLLQLAFSGTGLAVAATVGVLVGVFALYEKGANQLNEFNRTVIASGDSLNLSARDLSQQVTVIGAATGHYGDAAEALNKLGASGKFAGTNLENAAQGAVAFADITGQSIDKAVAEFTKLATEPAKASEELNKQYHYLSESQYEEIDILQRVGDRLGAARLATDLFASSMIDRDQQYKASLTGIAKLWDDVKTKIEGAADASANFLQRRISSGIGGGAAIAASVIGGGAALGGALGGAPTPTANFKNVTATSTDQQNALNESLIETHKDLGVLTDDLTKQAETYGLGKKGLAEYTVEQRLLALAASGVTGPALAEAADKIQREGDVAVAAGAKYDELVKAHKSGTADIKASEKAWGDINLQIQQGIAIATAAVDVQGKLSGAFASYEVKLHTVAQALADLDAERANHKISDADYAQQQALLAAGAAALTEAITLQTVKQEALDAVRTQSGDAIDTLNKKWSDELAALGQSSDAHELETEKLKDEKSAQDALTQAIANAKTPEDVANLVAKGKALRDNADAYAQATVEAKKNLEVEKQWTSIWTSGFQQFGDGIGKIAGDALFHFKSIGDTFKSVGQLLEDTAQSIVQAIISQFVKLAVINPILNSIFGSSGGWNMLATLGGSGGSGGGIASIGLDALSAGGSGVGAGVDPTSSGGSGLGTAGGLFGIGKTIWSGFQSGASGIGNLAGNFWNGTSGSIGTGAYAGTTGDLGGLGYNLPGAGSAGYTGAYGGYGSGFGQALGVAGGVYAGYNEYQKSGSVVGAAAYGVGTYALGAGLASAAAGTGFAAGVGGAVAIPVVGWVALAAMLIDQFSGGKLFGTKGKVESGQTYLNVGNTGDSVDASVNLKGQKALFGGSKWSTKDIAVDAATQAAADAFYAALRKGSDEFAKQFGLTAGTVVDATFKTVLDNKGKPTGETETTIGGQTFTNETQAQFGERVQAADITADLLAAGIDIAKYTKDAINDADAYAKAVQDTAAAAQTATTDIKNGFTFLGVTGKQTVQSLLDFAAANVQTGEDVGQAYQRIEQAQASYNQFVGQFKPPATYASSFQQALQGVADQYKANVIQANALAVAAGAAGASQADLTNIQTAAAQAMANAIAQLHASSEALANSLGYTTQGESVDQLNQEISQLESGANSAAQSTNAFGNAMQAASQKAQDAINLLLGNDSPLTDSQKLQTALAGLRAGTVSQTAVLDIGRRLYATSAAYTQLFNYVQTVPGLQASAAAGGNTGGKVPLSAADQAKLDELKKQRDAAEALQRHNDAVQLAHNIADEAKSTGKSIDDVAASLDVNLSDLMKDLGIKSRDDLNTVLAQYEAQQDSAHNDNTDIIAAINSLPAAIAAALLGTSGNPGVQPGAGVNDTGHSTHGGPGSRTAPYGTIGGHSTHGSADAVGEAVGGAILRVVGNGGANSNRRSGRIVIGRP